MRASPSWIPSRRRASRSACIAADPTTASCRAAPSRSTCPSAATARRRCRWWSRCTAASDTVTTSSGPGCGKPAARPSCCSRRARAGRPGRSTLRPSTCACCTRWSSPCARTGRSTAAGCCSPGLSDGATFTLLAGLAPDSPFSHLAPVSGVLHPANFANGNLARARGRRVRLCHGALDWLFPVTLARARARRARAGGRGDRVPRDSRPLARVSARGEPRHPALARPTRRGLRGGVRRALLPARDRIRRPALRQEGFFVERTSDSVLLELGPPAFVSHDPELSNPRRILCADPARSKAERTRERKKSCRRKRRFTAARERSPAPASCTLQRFGNRG